MQPNNTYNPIATGTSNQSAIDLPEKFFCRITQDIMNDPVTASDGCNYERSAIVEWLKKAGKDAKSPFNNLPFPNDTLEANLTLKAEIAAWRRTNMPPAPPLAVLSVDALQSPSASQPLFVQNNEPSAWWQKQARLWSQARNSALRSMPAIQTQEMRDTLTSTLNESGTISHHAARALLLQGASAQLNLRSNAIKERNTELVELLSFRLQAYFTAKDYALAIRRNNNISFLSWMLEITLPDGSDLKIQQETAKIHDAALMQKALIKTGGVAFNETVKATIHAENISALPVVLRALEQTFEEGAQNQRWIEFTALALKCKNNEILTIILSNRPDTVVLPNGLYDELSHHFNPASLRSLLAANIPLPNPDIYLTLFDAFKLKIGEIQKKINNNNTQLALIILHSRAHSPCEIACISTFFLGFTTMLTFGVLYYNNQVNEAIKRHPNDDNIDDEQRQHHQNYNTGLALIVVGGFFLTFAICAVAELIQLFFGVYREKLSTYYNNHVLQTEEKQLISNFSKITSILADNNIVINSNDLNTLINTANSTEMINVFTDAYRKTNDPNYRSSQSWCAKFCLREVRQPIILAKPEENTFGIRII